MNKKDPLEILKKIKESEKIPDMSGSKSRREFQQKIRLANARIPFIMGLFFFLCILIFIGKIFGWW